MQGPHQCAPTYSPNTEWPGLVANLGISFACNSSLSALCSSIAKYPIADIVKTRNVIETEDSFFTRKARTMILGLNPIPLYIPQY